MNTGLLTIAQPHHYESEEQTFDAAVYNTLTFALPIAQIPVFYRVVAVCKVRGYAGCDFGEEVDAASGVIYAAATVEMPAIVTFVMPGTISLHMTNGAGVVVVRVRGNISTTLAFTSTNFRLKVYCMWPPLT